MTILLPFFVVKISNGKKYLTARGRTDDGSDESVVSPKLAKRAVLDGFGRFQRIKPISLQVALKNDGDSQKFTFYKLGLLLAMYNFWPPVRSLWSMSHF